MGTTWNPTDKHSSVTLSNENLTATTSTGYVGVRATNKKTSGKWYFEVNIDVVNGNGVCIGICNSSMLLANGYGSNCKLLMSGNGSYYPEVVNITQPFGAGVTVGVAFDADDKKISWYKDGVICGTGNYQFGSNITGDLYPTILLHSTTVTVNFGATPFKYSPPAGYGTWDNIINSLPTRPQCIGGF